MDIASFLIYCTIATFTPGPTNIVILSIVNQSGAKKAMNYSYGATAGFGLLLAVSAALNTVLVTILPKVLLTMQVVGSMYMLYLAYLMFRKHTSNPTEVQAATFISGFLMQFLNPKVVLFTLTVIPAFILPYYHAVPAVTLSILAITGIGFLAFTTWVLFGTIFRVFLQKHNKVVNIAMAVLLVYAAIMVWK
ncbi:LysE family translocator [Paenibacillus mesotrionivorans]|uniref:LysE family translocator n=1 Tax=Paenibacillus mesotrionivorans TaxID=3160968 RepID=A0ACC7NVE3_9BACL